MAKVNTKHTGKKEVPILSKSLQQRFMAIVFFSAFLLYANTIGHDYTLDDDIYTKKNIYIQQGFSALPQVFGKGSLHGFNGVNEQQYRPLTMLNFLIDTAIFGNNPQVEHFFNVVLYGITAIILLLFLQKIFVGYNHLIPLAITLLYIFHPVHTEIVASIKSREEIIGFLFALLSLLYLMKYVENEIQKKNLVKSVAFLTLSVFCKENTLTFIGVVPLVLYTFTKLDLKRIFVLSIPFALVVLFYIIVRASVLDNIAFKEKIIVMNNALMAAKTVGDMVATNFVILGKYLWLLLFPVDLTWDYSFNQVGIYSWSNIKPIFSLLLHLGMLTYVAFNFQKRNVFVFCILYYIITIFLSSNLLIKIGATMGERFLYVPSLGFCIATVLIIVKLLKLTPTNMVWTNKTGLYALMGAVLLLFGFKTIDRNKAWENNFTLFTEGIKVSTQSARAHFAVASEYRVKGEAEPDPIKRKQYFEQSVEKYNSGIAIYADDAEVWYNLGVTYYAMGDYPNALKVYTRAIELRPNYSMALNNTGVIYFNAKDYDKALGYFTKIIETDTTFVDAYSNAGAAYHNKANYKMAVSFYEKALQKNPNNKSTINNIVLVYKALGDTLKANMYAQRAAQLP